MNDRIISDELVYDGKVAKVHKLRMKMPDGDTVLRDFIHYPGAAVVLPVLADGSIALIRNYRFAVDECLYELPAGNLEEGEDPAVCAARELAEETGFTAGKIERLGVFYSAPGTTDEALYAYLAVELVDGPQSLEKHEEISVEVTDPYQIREMVADGRIHDAKTISALALYWLRSGLPE